MTTVVGIGRVFGVFLLIASLGGIVPTARGGCREIADDSPRTLVLAIDGVPLRTIERARKKGAFTGWPETQPLISTFPSVTNVAFSAILRPFGADPAGGYEVSHYDLEQKKVVGSTPFGYEERLNPWRDVFDVTSRTVGSKLKTYTAPKSASRKALHDAEEALYSSSKELVLAHVGATDALIHLRGDKAILKFVMEIDKKLQEIRERHEAATGRPLRVILLSDHGNSSIKIHKASGLRDSLREAGLKVVKHLNVPGEVVAPTFGLVGYGALFTHQEDAELAGRAVAGNAFVDVAAWRSGPWEMNVASEFGRAVVRWREGPADRWSLSYESVAGDPLLFDPVVETMYAHGELDRDGFADEDLWFARTVRSEYPDALRRLIHSLTGTYVSNYATVVFSLKPGYAWGWTSAHVSSVLSGGRLEGTHGGLDRDSSVGFFLSSDPLYQPDAPVRTDTALQRFSGMEDCLLVTGFDSDHGEFHAD